VDGSDDDDDDDDDDGLTCCVRLTAGGFGGFLILAPVNRWTASMAEFLLPLVIKRSWLCFTTTSNSVNSCWPLVVAVALPPPA